MNKLLEKLLIAPGASIKEALQRLSAGGEKTLFVVDGQQKLLGVISDGDLRRYIFEHGSVEGNIDACTNTHPITFSTDHSMNEAATIMLEHRIGVLPIIGTDGRIISQILWDDAFASAPRELAKVECKVVVMAGGQGTRLEPFTRILPKPLIPIGDTPIIEIIMNRIAEHGVEEFTLSVNHKAHVMKAYFQEKRLPYKVRFIEEEETLGTAGALKFLDQKMRTPVVVTNCDTVIKHPLDEILQFHSSTDSDITIVGALHQYAVPYGVCEIEKGGVLTAIREKPAFDFLINTGMYVTAAKVFKYIPANGAFDFTELVEKVQKSGGRVSVFPIDNSSWLDVGQWEEYRSAVRAIDGV